MDCSSTPEVHVRVSIQPGGDDGCRITRYDSATSDMVEVEELLNDHEQALKDISKLEHYEFISEQKRLADGGALPATDDARAAGATAQMLLLRESAKIKMVKELLLSATSGASWPCASRIVFL